MFLIIVFLIIVIGCNWFLFQRFITPREIESAKLMDKTPNFKLHNFIGAVLIATGSLFLTLLIFKNIYVYPICNLVFFYFFNSANRMVHSNARSDYLSKKDHS